jgi:hypothetical protein
MPAEVVHVVDLLSASSHIRLALPARVSKRGDRRMTAMGSPTRGQALLLSATSALFVVAMSGGVRAIEMTEEVAPAPEAVREGTDEAFAQDISLLAEAMGLPDERVGTSVRFHDDFAGFSQKLLDRYPGQVSALWVEPVPAVRAHVTFVGTVPAGVADDAARSGLDITVNGQGLIALDDHRERARVAFDALFASGYRNVVTFYSEQRNVIRIELVLPPEAHIPTAMDVAELIQARVASGNPGELSDPRRLMDRAALIEPSDLELIVKTGNGPFVQSAHSRGGNWLLDDGVRECTSGFSVVDNGGVRGVMTAGHCAGLNRFEEPGVAPYGMTFKDQSWGEGGDVEWHTTTHDELAEFYSSEFVWRDVTGIRSTNAMVNNSVCGTGGERTSAPAIT